MVNETLEQQIHGQQNDFQRFVDSASQNHVIEINIDEKIRKTIDNVVLTVENRMHDAILISMDKVVIPRVEMTVRSITVSSEHGPNS